MATVDSLDIQISAESKKASASIDLLVKKVDRLSASLSGVNSRGLATLGSGVNKLSNSMSNFSKNTKNADFTRLANSLNKLSGVKTASLLSVSPAIKNIANSVNSIKDMNFGNNAKQISTLVKSLGSLSKITPASIKSATTAIGKVAGAMNGIKGMDFGDNPTRIAELSKSISSLGGKASTNAITNIPKLASAMKKFLQTMATAPKVSKNIIEMTNAIGRFARTGASGGRAAKSLSNGFTAISSKMKGLPKSFNIFNKSAKNSVSIMKSFKGNISSLVGSFGGIYAVFNGLKESINISSDVTEVQNVVDTAFGDYKKRIEDLSNVSIPELGMSELTTKQIASRFQAMGTSMGFSQKAMADMSVDLTRLTADMASFYNVAQSDMGKSLQSIFTGETEPMRRYGIDLTNATIQQWAMKQGIDANMRSMTLAEKTMLRYRYVMENTGAAQGDFLRTQNSWANQTRMLSENIKELAKVVGGTLINALKPMVKALNVVIQQITKFATMVSNALGKIFGWTYEEGGGASNPADEMASSMKDVTDATNDATKAQKELNKQLGTFDELNNYTSSDSGSGDAGTSGTGDVSSSLSGTGGKWEQGKSIIKSFESEIDSLYKLGKKIGDTVSSSLSSIDWKKVYAKANSFGTGLADFLNGLISTDIFKELGGSIAGSLNTALNFLNSFGKTFDWKQFGKSLSDGIKEFFKKFDWDLAVDTFNTLANGILDAILSMLDGISASDWKDVGNKIADIISGIDIKGITFKLGSVGNDLANALNNVISDKSIFKNTGEKIGDAINGFFGSMGEIDKETGLTGWQAMGKNISSTISGLIDTISTALGTADWEQIGKDIVQFLTSIDWMEVLTSATNLIAKLAVALFNLLKGALTEGVKQFKKIVPENLKKLGDFAIEIQTKIKDTAVEFGKKLLDFIKKVPGKVVELGINIAEKASEFGKKLFDFLKTIPGKAIGLVMSIATSIPDMASKLTSFVSQIPGKIIGLAINIISKIPDVAKSIGSFIKGLPQKAFGLLINVGSKLSSVASAIAGFVSKLPAKAFGIGINILSKVGDVAGNIASFILQLPAKAFGFSMKIISKIPDVAKSIGSFIRGLPDKAYNFGLKLGAKVSKITSTIVKFIKSIPEKVYNLGIKVGTKVSDLTKKIKDIAGSVFEKVKSSLSFSVTFATDSLKASIKTIIGWINKYIIGSLNKISVSIPDWVPGMGGKKFGFDLPEINIPKFEMGGFPEDGWFRASKGEYFGKFDDGTSYIANNRQIENGIASEVGGAVRNANMEQNALLREQNELLRELIAKDNGITSSEIFGAVRKEASNYKKRTGIGAFSY